MDARFAGSQRLGERRRRRLAVESEELQTSESPGESLPVRPGAERTVHRVAEQPPADLVPLPLQGLIPAQWWKYALGAVCQVLVGAGILAAAWQASIWSTFTGPGMTRLFSLPDPPVAAWYSGILLNLSAQLALLIWWGRSRSLTDFDGRYRLWTRTAAVWMSFGFCAVTGAHLAWSETVLHYWRPAVPQIDVLAWLVPAAATGLVFLYALNREMSDCRNSRVLLFVAAACYAAAGSLQLEFKLPLAARMRELAQVGSALLGHVALFLSMWLHARHVLHFTADPSSAPRRRLRIPRPHFRLPKFGFSRRRADSPEAEASATPEQEPARRSKSRKPRKSSAATKRTATSAAAEEQMDEPEVSGAKSPAEPVRRAPQQVAAVEPEADAYDDAPVTAEQEGFEQDCGQDLQEPLTLPPRRETSQQESARREIPRQETLRHAASRQETAEASRAEESAVAAASGTESTHDSSGDQDEDEAWTESFPKPDMRGMSKKQRRKLMQELRDKERSQRRK